MQISSQRILAAVRGANLFMTSEERREARYQRRKAARLARKQARCDALGPVDEIFSFRKLFYYGKKCCNGVRWKQSTQNFELHLFSGTARRRRDLLSGKWRPKKCAHFILRERGKVRPIDAPHITDRQLQKAISKEVLVPLYTPSLIYDNYASRSGMGLHFAFQRLNGMLHWHFRHYGRSGGVAIIDLREFYLRARRELIYQRHRRLILVAMLRAIADAVINTAPSTAPGLGMPLGVEPSQHEMMALPSDVDNWIKCQLGVHCVGHYADDYFIICPDMNKLRQIGNAIVRKFEQLGIPVNRKKCKIVPLTKPFKFCKAKFTLHESGKITVNGCRDGVKRARRKLKLFRREWIEGKRSLQEVAQYMTCQCAYYRNYNDHGRLLRLWRLCYALFGGKVKCSKSKAMVVASA